MSLHFSPLLLPMLCSGVIPQTIPRYEVALIKEINFLIMKYKLICTISYINPKPNAPEIHLLKIVDKN